MPDPCRSSIVTDMLHSFENCAHALSVPDWVPADARHYLDHVSTGKSLRAVARQSDSHASTIMRQVHRIETRRDDPLVDAVLTTLTALFRPTTVLTTQGTSAMLDMPTSSKIATSTEINREARRILRRLCEHGAFLAVSDTMKMAAVMRVVTPGKPVRTAVVERRIAQTFALQDWIKRDQAGRISRYHITTVGKAALKRLLLKDPAANNEAGFDEAQSPFQEQHKVWGERTVYAGAERRKKRMRCNLAESPVTALGRRKDADGEPFLSSEMIMAGERLREDFEMAQMGPRITQNWDRFLTNVRASGSPADNAPAAGPMSARSRVSDALADLGPGLGDIALRCCCFLEGMEAAEKRLGWSSRSGKVVLRIALQRLKSYYEAHHGGLSPMIG